MSANRIRRHNDPSNPWRAFIQRIGLQKIHINPKKSMEDMGDGHIKARSISNVSTHNKRRHFNAAIQ